jgi:hypothetical protein
VLAARVPERDVDESIEPAAAAVAAARALQTIAAGERRRAEEGREAESDEGVFQDKYVPLLPVAPVPTAPDRGVSEIEFKNIFR